MLKKSLLVFALLTIVIVSGSMAQDAIRIGAIFDLSGPTQDVSQPYAEGVAAYIAFVNANGGINGVPLDLRAADYGNDVNTAVRAYSQFAGEGIVAFLGWGTDDTIALASSAANDEIPFLSASYSEALNDPNGDAPYNFVVAPTYGDQVTVMLAYMVSLWENDGGNAADMSVAIFHDDSAFGTDPLRTALDAADQLNIGGVLAVEMARGATDFTAELQETDDYGVTHFIIQSTPRPAAVLARNIAGFFGQGEKIVGCLNWCADEQFIAAAGGAADGVLGAMPFAPTSVNVDGQADARSFLSSRGESLTSATLHFTQGWATAQLLVEAIQRVSDAGLPIDGQNVRAALETFDEVETGDLLAPVTFTASDHRGSRALSIYEVVNGQWVQSSQLVKVR